MVHILKWKLSCRHKTNLCPERHKLGVVLVIKLIKYSHILAITHQPVDRRKVLALSKFFVQTPKHLSLEKVSIVN